MVGHSIHYDNRRWSFTPLIGFLWLTIYHVIFNFDSEVQGFVKVTWRMLHQYGKLEVIIILKYGSDKSTNLDWDFIFTDVPWRLTIHGWEPVSL